MSSARSVAVALAAATTLGLAVLPAPPAGADGALGPTIDVSVNSTPVIQIPASMVAQEPDIQGQFTTVHGLVFSGNPKSEDGTTYTQLSGMSFGALANLARIPLAYLAQPPLSAVEVSNGELPGPANAMNLTASEVTDGFDDPCMKSSPGCILGDPPDTTPNFAVVASDFSVVRPLRTLPSGYPDSNADNEIITGSGRDLLVNFNTTGIPLTVSAPSPAFTEIPDGGSVTFDATSVTVLSGGSPDTRLPFGYSWNFGDGMSGTGIKPSHVYTTPGRHLVFVTVTDGGLPQSGGVSAPITVVVDPPPPTPPTPNLPVTQSTPTPRPHSAPSPHPAPRPTSPTPVSHAVVSPVPAHMEAPHPTPSKVGSTKVTIPSDGGGSGSGTGSGSGNGVGAGSGRGSATGAAGGTGHSAQGVAVGGDASSRSPTSQEGKTSTSLPSRKVNGLVGVLIDPSGGVVSLSPAANSVAAQAAAAARALAGGGRSPVISWLWWLLGAGLTVFVMGSRALVEFEPRAAYRSLRNDDGGGN